MAQLRPRPVDYRVHMHLPRVVVVGIRFTTQLHVPHYDRPLCSAVCGTHAALDVRDLLNALHVANLLPSRLNRHWIQPAAHSDSRVLQSPLPPAIPVHELPAAPMMGEWS